MDGAGVTNTGSLFVSSSGNVGIGTINPITRLVVVGNGTGQGLIGDLFGSGNYTGIALNGSNSSSNYNFLSSPTDQILYINRPTGFAIRFREANGGDQMTIIAGGNVGIGLQSPTAKLHVSGAGLFETDNDAIVTIKSRTNAFNPTLRFQEDTSIIRWQLIAAESDGGKFKISGSGAGEALTIVSNNNIGIGTTNPGAKLDVSGSAIISGSINATGPITGSGFTTTGTITAQTLVVQTVTSSVSFITGSTKFGVLAANTHQFTGSMNVSGSSNFLGNLTVSGFGSNAFSAGGTGYNRLILRNTTAGAANGAQLSVGSDADPDQLYIQSFSTTFTTSGMNVAGGAVINGEGPGGLNLAATQANIGLYTNGSTSANLRMFISSSGNVGVGTSSPLSTFVVNGNNAGGRGGEISIVNIGGSTVGSEAALNFGFGTSTYNGDSGNGQIKAVFVSGNEATDMVFSSWNGSAWGEKMRITSGGELCLNTTSALGSGLFSLQGASSTYNLIAIKDTGTAYSSTNNNFIYFMQSTGGTCGSISHASATTVNYYSGPSDERKKENIQDWSQEVLPLFADIKPKTYNHIEDYDSSYVYKGFLAQDMVDKFPEAYGLDKEGFYSFNPSGYIPYLVKAIQELKAEIDELKNK